jgi:hypothetical protein
MARQAGFWSVEDRLAEISHGGDPLETLSTTVDFEMFRPILERSYARIWVTRADQAARFLASLGAMPSVNLMPSTTRGN